MNFQVNLVYPVSFFCICGFLVLLPVYVSPMLVGVDMLILFVGVIFYFVFIYWKNKPAVVRKMLRKRDLCMYFIYSVCLS